MTHSDFAEFEAAMRAAPLIGFLDIQGVSQASGTYTAWWEDDAGCFYVGKALQLRGRLRSHDRGQRGNDQFCLYVYDSYIFPTRRLGLTTSEVNTLTRQWIQENVKFRCVEVSSAGLSAHENYLRQKWQPVLNPLPPQMSYSGDGA